MLDALHASFDFDGLGIDIEEAPGPGAWSRERVVLRSQPSGGLRLAVIVGLSPGGATPFDCPAVEAAGLVATVLSRPGSPTRLLEDVDQLLTSLDARAEVVLADVTCSAAGLAVRGVVVGSGRVWVSQDGVWSLATPVTSGRGQRSTALGERRRLSFGYVSASGGIGVAVTGGEQSPDSLDPATRIIVGPPREHHARSAA